MTPLEKLVTLPASMAAFVMLAMACDPYARPSDDRPIEVLAFADEVATVGEATRRKSLSYEDHTLFARTLVGECGQCSDAELTAISYVVLNRLADGRWGRSIGDVVLFSKGDTFAFSTWDHRRANINEAAGEHVTRSAPYARAWQIADDAWQDAQRLKDPTQGAKFYWHPASMPHGATPRWARKKPFMQIGGARFVR